jgi:hypothetical protein
LWGIIVGFFPQTLDLNLKKLGIPKAAASLAWIPSGKTAGSTFKSLSLSWH